MSGALAWTIFRVTSRVLRRQASTIRQSSSNLQNAIASLRSDRREIMQPTLECAKGIVVEYDELATIVEDMSCCNPRDFDFGERLPGLRAKAKRIEELRKHMQQVNDVFSRQVFDHAPSSAPKIVKPPGTFWLALTNLVFTPKVCRRVFEPIVADMRSEYFSALSSGNRNEARIALVRGWIAFMRVLVASVLLFLSGISRFRD